MRTSTWRCAPLRGDAHQAEHWPPPPRTTCLVQPHGGEDEEELDEHGAKGQHAAHHAGEHRVHVPGLVRDLWWGGWGDWGAEGRGRKVSAHVSEGRTSLYARGLVRSLEVKGVR